MAKPTKQVIVAKGIANLPSMGAAAVGLVHERLPADHPTYATIGKVAAQWAELEHVLDSIIWRLASLQPPVGACITSQMMGSTNKFYAIASLAEHLGKSAELKRRIVKLLGRSYEPQEMRNRIVHDTWFVRADNGELGQLRMFSRKHQFFKIDPVTESKISEHINAVQNLIDEINSLKRDLLS